MLKLGSKLLLIPAFLIITLFVISVPSFAQSLSVDIKFVNHPQASFPEQDVFVNKNGQAFRLEASEATQPANLSLPVYKSAQMVEHDPFKMGQTPLGPFTLGEALGFTMGDWLAGTGSGTYTVNGDNAKINLTLQKLVPDSTYTVWCSRLTFPPNVKVVDRPCGKEDGSENVFKTDASGNGSFDLNLKPLEESTKETASLIALAYHSDGKTYGSVPGEFGNKTHVQLFFPLPAKEAIAAEGTSLPAASTETTSGIANWIWWLLGGIVVIAIFWWFMKRSRGV